MIITNQHHHLVCWPLRRMMITIIVITMITNHLVCCPLRRSGKSFSDKFSRNSVSADRLARAGCTCDHHMFICLLYVHYIFIIWFFWWPPFPWMPTMCWLVSCLLFPPKDIPIVILIQYIDDCSNNYKIHYWTPFISFHLKREIRANQIGYLVGMPTKYNPQWQEQSLDSLIVLWTCKFEYKISSPKWNCAAYRYEK